MRDMILTGVALGAVAAFALTGGLPGATAHEDEERYSLEKRLAALEGDRPAPAAELPSEEDFEKTLGYMERFFRRFMGIIQDFEQEQPAPNRT